jgi:hypothetical protein
MADSQMLSREGTLSLTKPMLGLAVGGTLGLLDGLSGFFEPSLTPVMGSVITFSLLKGLVAGVSTGYVSQRVHSMLLGILAGIGIAAALSLLVILRAGIALFLGHPPPGYAARGDRGIRNARFGRAKELVVAGQ